MTCHRRYYFEHPEEITTGHSKVMNMLQHACETDWWYNEPTVEGQPFNRLSFSFTVSARDQWWAHRRAMRLAEACYVSMGMSVRKVPEPMWESLEPHSNRGRYRTPR
jgi:hypothetical protein